jgi:hypothetical protein
METKNTKSSDEIDLLYFFNPLIRGFKNFQLGFDKYMKTLQRKRFIFLFIMLFIALAGFLLRYFIPKYYKTNAIFISYNLPADFCALMIDNLQTLTSSSSNTSILAQQLNISEQLAAGIHSISAESLDSFSIVNERDSSALATGKSMAMGFETMQYQYHTAGSAFRVNMIVKSKASVTEIQKGVQYFLENNEFSLKRKEARRKTLEALKNNFIIRGKSLDSLKGIVNSFLIPRGVEHGSVLGEPVSPIQIYKLQETYYRQQLDIEAELSLLNNIEVVQPFFKINNSNYPDFNELFCYSLFIGFLIAVIVTPLIGNKN